MKKMTGLRQLLLACVVASLALAGGCIGGGSGGNNGNNGNNGSTADTGMSDDTGSSDDTGMDDDTGTPEDTGSSEDTGTPDDTGTDDDTGTPQDTGTPEDTGTPDDGGSSGCDVDGFTPASGTDIAITEDGISWSFFAGSDAGDQVLSLTIDKNGGADATGTYDFQDVPADDAVNQLLMADGCTQSSCETYYYATSGSFEITTWDQTDDGAFEVTFSNVELVEISIDDQSGDISRVSGGKTWCVASLSVTATVNAMEPFAANCDTNDFTADGDITAEPFGNGGVFVEALSANSEPNDSLSLEIYPSFDGAATSAGTYQIDDYNYASCANCLLIYADCDSTNGCDKIYVAGEGTLDITSTGGDGDQFTATLTDAKFAEATIDQSYNTDLVEGGAGWCISSFSWDVTLQSSN